MRRISFCLALACGLCAGVLSASPAVKPSGSSGFGYLELYVPAASDSAGAKPGKPAWKGRKESPDDEITVWVALHIMFPDTLGQVAVLPFLQGPEDKAREALEPKDWQAKSLTPAERRFLQALRNLVDGRIIEAKVGLEPRGPKPSPKVAACLRIDAAVLLYLLGLPKEAEKDFQRALRAGDAAGQGAVAEGAWRNLFSMHLSRREFKKAHGLVDQVLREAPKNKWALSAKGYLLRLLSPDEELEAFLKAKSSWKDSSFAIQIAYGKFLKDKGQWEEAIKYYNRGLDGAPANGPAWLELADAYFQTGYLIMSEKCLRTAFAIGINDPYAFELYSRILQEVSGVADTGNVLTPFGFGWDSAWAARLWQASEKIMEEGFPHNLHSRSMAHLLYQLYCHNGRVEAAANLRAGFWFHFTGPAMPAHAPPLRPPARPPRIGLALRLSEITFPWAWHLKSKDFFDASEWDLARGQNPTF